VQVHRQGRVSSSRVFPTVRCWRRSVLLLSWSCVSCVKLVEVMIGIPLLENSRVSSGRLNSNTHGVALVSCNCWIICCASPIVCTGVLLILMSQAPWRCVRQRGNLSPGVCDDMVARSSLLLCSTKLRPAFLCRKR